MPLKTGPKRIAKSTGKPDRRARDNKSTPGNTPSLKPSKSTKKKQVKTFGKLGYDCYYCQGALMYLPKTLVVEYPNPNIKVRNKKDSPKPK